MANQDNTPRDLTPEEMIQFGVTPQVTNEARDLTPEEMLQFGVTPSEIGIVDTVKDLFTGASQETEATRTLPEFKGGAVDPTKFTSDPRSVVEELSKKFTQQAGLLTTFNPKAEIDIITKNNPDATFSEDEKGNVIVNIPKGDGSIEQSILNLPGVSVTDLRKLGAAVVAFTPATKIAGAVKAVAPRIAAGFTGATATDLALQAASKTAGSQQEFDFLQALITGVAGGLTEGLVPAYQAGKQLAKNIIAKKASAIESRTASLVEAGEVIKAGKVAEVPITTSDVVPGNFGESIPVIGEQFGKLKTFIKDKMDRGPLGRISELKAQQATLAREFEELVPDLKKVSEDDAAIISRMANESSDIGRQRLKAAEALTMDISKSTDDILSSVSSVIDKLKASGNPSSNVLIKELEKVFEQASLGTSGTIDDAFSLMSRQLKELQTRAGKIQTLGRVERQADIAPLLKSLETADSQAEKDLINRSIDILEGKLAPGATPQSIAKSSVIDAVQEILDPVAGLTANKAATAESVEQLVKNMPKEVLSDMSIPANRQQVIQTVRTAMEAHGFNVNDIGRITRKLDKNLIDLTKDTITTPATHVNTFIKDLKKVNIAIDKTRKLSRLKGKEMLKSWTDQNNLRQDLDKIVSRLQGITKLNTEFLMDPARLAAHIPGKSATRSQSLKNNLEEELLNFININVSELKALGEAFGGKELAEQALSNHTKVLNQFVKTVSPESLAVIRTSVLRDLFKKVNQSKGGMKDAPKMLDDLLKSPAGVFFKGKEEGKLRAVVKVSSIINKNGSKNIAELLSANDKLLAGLGVLAPATLAGGIPGAAIIGTGFAGLMTLNKVWESPQVRNILLGILRAKNNKARALIIENKLTPALEKVIHTLEAGAKVSRPAIPAATSIIQNKE